ncbi:MAG TPA: XF1762 family protein [Verrucomicrobiae bacterium]|nr:XF1762 family protein [Verrucomicrobiae bacterium]
MTAPRTLQLVPISLAEANEFVRLHHRHHNPVPGAKFCVAVATPGVVHGVAIVGRPIARMADDGWTLEVNRTCTDGTKNVNSMLYGACQRATFALGYKKLITYTLPTESGASLRAVGWTCIGSAGGGRWSRESRPRIDTHPLQEKLRWEVTA